MATLRGGLEEGEVQESSIFSTLLLRLLGVVTAAAGVSPGLESLPEVDDIG